MERLEFGASRDCLDKKYAWWADCPEAKLRGTWASIVYARRIVQANYFIIKDDSTTIIVWIYRARKTSVTYPLFHDISSSPSGFF